jgi:polysaccharide export outer membrane protein
MTHRSLIALLLAAYAASAQAAFAQDRPAAQPPPVPLSTTAPPSTTSPATTAPLTSTPTDPTVVPDPKDPRPDGTSGRLNDAPKAAPDSATAALPLDPRVADMATAFQIGPEDLLDISVWKNVELSRMVPVRPDGMVSLPLVNDIKAAGLTPSELRDQITSKLAEYIPAPEVSVMVREVHSRKVTVTGAVKTPGRYELRSPMTVLEVIALGGGLTDFASRDKIVIIRYVNGQTTRIPFNYRKIADGAGQDNFFLRPGDIVVVP